MVKHHKTALFSRVFQHNIFANFSCEIEIENIQTVRYWTIAVSRIICDFAYSDFPEKSIDF